MRHPVFHFFSLSVPFLLIFPTFQIRQHISCFLSFYLILLSLFLLFYSFNVFPVQTCFPLPLHLSGLLFSFLRTILLFSHLSTFFILPLCFLPLTAIFSSASPLSLLLSCFFAFSPTSYYICLFSAVFRLLCRFFTLFLPFFSFSSIFSLLLMSLSQAHFLRFAPLKMFHVKHRFSRFSVFSGQ